MRVYKGLLITDHDTDSAHNVRVHRRYSVDFRGTNYEHDGRDMATLTTGWYFTLAAAKLAIRDHWEALRRG
jgi:hypothetical protein